MYKFTLEGGDSNLTVSVPQLDTLVRFTPNVSQLGFASPTDVLPTRLQLLAHYVLGGEGGIRTPDTVTRIHPFQGCAINHSATSP